MDIIQFLILDCYDPDLLKIIYFLKILLNIAFAVIPAGAIIMLSLDMAKNVIAGREDEMSKNFNVFIKRILSLACVFLVFIIVEFVMSFVNVEGVDGTTAWLACWNNAELSKIQDLDVRTDFEDFYNEVEGTYEGWKLIESKVFKTDMTNSSSENKMYVCDEQTGGKYHCDVYIPE